MSDDFEKLNILYQPNSTVYEVRHEINENQHIFQSPSISQEKIDKSNSLNERENVSRLSHISCDNTAHPGNFIIIIYLTKLCNK